MWMELWWKFFPRPVRREEPRQVQIRQVEEVEETEDELNQYSVAEIYFTDGEVLSVTHHEHTGGENYTSFMDDNENVILTLMDSKAKYVKYTHLTTRKNKINYEISVVKPPKVSSPVRVSRLKEVE